MKPFLDHDFLLQNDTAKMLYHDYAQGMPIIDYHCHLPQAQIATDHQFENLTQIWLNGDHYKWRAMRANGVNEHFITGNATDRQKFQSWAETVPFTLRNPLHHWTHLELQRYFDIHTILNGDTAEEIYNECTEKLQSPQYSVRSLLQHMNVKLICTTDDPIDNLAYHQQLANEQFSIPVIPAFRPDQAMNVNDASAFNIYVKKLAEASGVTIANYHDYLDALKQRHDFFAANGCSVSDHGLEHIYADDFTESAVVQIFAKVSSGTALSSPEISLFKSAMLVQFAEWDFEKGWVQQYHLGAMRNNNSRMFSQLGPDTGWDSIGDYRQGITLSKFLSRVDGKGKLAKTILYNLNPGDNQLMASMIGNFNDGSFPGKVQYGAAWWFNDQKDGMINQINALSNMGLLSRSVGMLTDSRSFLSFPRHEYFRRILCNMLGQEMENGEIPNDIALVGKMVQNICYNNARTYFNWESIL